MKKIVSAVVAGALVIGAASAETKLSMNYRNGMNVYSAWNKGDGQTETNVTMFNQLGYNGGKDSVTLTASGDIFSFSTILQPTVESDSIVFNKLELGAKYGLDDLGLPGTIRFRGGWWRDGVSNGNIRITTDASNFEGLDWEGNKPGSIFKSRPTTFVTDMTNMAISDTLVTGLFDYTLPIDDLTINILASVMSDRAAQQINKKDSNNDTFTAEEQANDGAYSWGVNVNAKLKGLVELEAIAKGSPKWNAVLNEDGDDYAGAYAFAFYAMPLMVDGLKLAVGGSLGFVDGSVSDIAADLRLNYKIPGVDGLSITSYNNLSIAKQSAAKNTTDEYFNATLGRTYMGSSNSDKGSAGNGTMALWNMLGVAYKVTPTITARLSIEEQTILDRNESKADAKDDYKWGTELRFTPAVEFTATKGASILAGVTCAVYGIGADKYQDEAETIVQVGEALDWYWSIPVLFRVKM